MNKEQKSNLVLVEDFDLQAIRQAFREGRLYIQPQAKSEAEIREEGICQILQYVQSIEACASQEYYAHMRSLWDSVLHDDTLQPLCFMSKGKRKGKPNWYRITSIVCVMREYNVYRKRDFTTVDLHLLLEHSDHRNQIYESSTHYYLEHPQLMILKKIMQNFKNQQE